MSLTVEAAGDTREEPRPQRLDDRWPTVSVPAGAVGEWAALQAGLAVTLPPCRVEPALWSATRRTHAEAARQDVAREACSWCPLLEVCRAYALAAVEPDGVWGGTSPNERRAS